MKKKFLFFAASIFSLTFAACSDNDDPNQKPNPEPASKVDYGVFIVNAGNMYSNIDGSLGYIEFGSGDVFQNLFKEANNNATIGDTFNSGYVDGDYIYLAVTDSKVIHVIDRKTFELIKTISTSAGPRQITSYNGMVYVTLFGQPGSVVEIDPSSLEITRSIEVGPLPEYIVPFKGNLYVAVSDGYGDGSQASITVIDPASFNVTRNITGIVNPVNLATNGNQLYVCSQGQYLSEYPYTQYNYGVYEIKDNVLSEKLCEATYIYINNDKLYFMDASYSYGEDHNYSYGVLDTKNNKASKWINSEDGVDYPVAIGVDPVEGRVIILSYELGEGGYASYTTPGYAKLYTSDGQLIGKYNTGVGVTNMFFNVAD
ncbi:MAG: hypothetical protein J1F67_11700 [Muribaculaceae bacterium]|nr:hypothetical protein [Muribaculaceae bacterium]